ncbi:MAG: copper homeostasis protein CutC [Ginsengibacter sp.]
MKLEIIGFNIESCLVAQQTGADRIELCANPAEGGTTPSYGFIRAARKILDIDLYVMIRPRGGDFFYSDAEYEIMKNDVDTCKEIGCDGIVLGILNQDGSIDKKRCQSLLDYAYPLGITFHRAFDRTINPTQALEDIIDIGCERILTSGQQPKVMDGKILIKELIELANDRIIIMPGSGVTSSNLTELAEITGAKEFHSSAGMVRSSDMKYSNAAMKEELNHITTNGEEVKLMKEILKNLAAS